MQPEVKLVPKTNNVHNCCVPLSGHRNIYPIKLKENSDNDQNKQRQKVEAYVFRKLEEYSKKKTINILCSTSLSHIRRRLKHDIKPLSKQFDPNTVSKEKLHQWIDEILEQIQSHISQLRLLFQSQDNLEHFLTTDKFFSSKNIDNQWKQLQLQQAKKVLLKNANDNDEKLLSRYQKYIIEKFTPKELEDNKLILKNQKKIHLNKKFQEVEHFGREYLTKILDNYKQRQYPKLELVQEMIELGMEQMIKRPTKDEFRQASLSSNILDKATFILKSKQSYSMSLHNLADDFMLLRFGHSVDDENNNADESISDRFIVRIHMFLNTISQLVYLLKATNSSEFFSPLSLFNPFNSDLPKEYILSPTIYIDEWTWLLEKWKISLETLPINLTNQGAFSRLVRTTIGVGISRLFSFTINNEQDELDKKLFQALQMGFYYGIAYALVDGLQDNQNHQQKQFDVDKWLEKAEDILCGDQLNTSSLPQLPIIPLLLETFHSLGQLTSTNSITDQTFTDLALLLRSQRLDKKDLEKSNYNDIDLFLGPLLKAHFTYTATAFMGGANMIENHQRLWITPFLGQLTDDCRDFNEDYQAKSITPVTYYVQHNGSSFNPFFVFLFVCEDLYIESNRRKNTGAFLGRRIMRTLRSLGNDFKKFITIFTEKSYPKLYKYFLSLEYLFPRISDPEKAVFRYVNTFANNYSLNHRKLETFVYDCQPLIEKQLSIETDDNNLLVHGMNYSLKAGGKRLRPLLLLMVAQLYNMDIKSVLPVARALEYLHTSSLIFDDLPAQDNAPLRRGQPTLHMMIDSDHNIIPPSLTEGRAQLSAVNLIAYAIRSVTVDLQKENFSHESINEVVAEIAQSMSELCHGQFLDLQCSRTKKSLTIDELDRIAYLKTGKAIEIAIICPIILAKQDQPLDRFRELSRLMGILFQMKDDLLDVEGDTDELGKKINIDQENQTITYISLLGVKGTRNRIVNIRKQVESILNDLWPQAGTMRDLIQYICERKK
ncbi:unnamed protein product [Rotaria sordida]|uniref:Uncharacterized protein n=1 Tax=Rotaria sordida TaxID=392033 RepID=A0A814SW91_9BILA|nr:unnamed protein product [Rotaria sordida]